MQQEYANLSLEDRQALTRAIINLLDSWGIPDRDQVQMLCLPEGTPVRAIRQYRHDKPFPDDPALLERVEHIVGIADALRTTYPSNPAMGPIWIRRRVRRLRGRTPLSIMLEDGLNGLVQVRSHLDCSYAWHHSGSVR